MLRKVFSVGAIISLCCATAFGQVAIGVKGSLQLSNLTSSAFNQQNSNLIGFQAGLLLNAPINEQLSIRPQLLYSVKGSKAVGSAQGISVDAKLAINYLELPVQLAYGFEVGEGRVVVGAVP